MATILEDIEWTITEEVGDHMVETGLLVKCDAPHTHPFREANLPIYHISKEAPSWFGFACIPEAIISAEKAVNQT